MDRKASVLILALWSICLLSVFAVILSYTIRQRISLVERLKELEELSLIAEAGIKKTIFYLLKTLPEETPSNARGIWGENPAFFKNMAIGEGICNIGYEMEKNFYYGLIDEERKININTADLRLLKNFFQVVLGFDGMLAQDLAASIIDWRDEDNMLSVPLGSAEDAYYRWEKYSYEAKDAPFQVLDELLLVKGMNQDIFNKIKDYFTIYSDGRININTASREVLLSLGLKQETVDKIISFRLGPDGKALTFDDGIFDDPTKISNYLDKIYFLNEAEKKQLDYVAERYLTVQANYFMIKVNARLKNKKYTYLVTCVVDRNGHIFYWQEE